jgi:hypothetical protein
MVIFPVRFLVIEGSTFMSWHQRCWATSLAFVFSCVVVHAGEPETFSDVEFERLHRLIALQSGESRWMEIDWHPSIWEARRKAAAEGKPIFIMAGSGGAPAAGC